ncbi:hypothetical protein CYLTODRAFT_494711 [Cylindrobasidium torrendii FP15055 ss-10]|uniref:Uncharacterized protein n=1 Tax=Cylindrobasidium torrendii FP15055 ss-10 TaxID=1314674 RepID=A0A0D7AWV7_9AGAR|nr:hypothetical protein CYLTODRAFT_494711 [Cylindrobasidium torrendii FP15055 ss-10]
MSRAVTSKSASVKSTPYSTVRTGSTGRPVVERVRDRQSQASRPTIDPSDEESFAAFCISDPYGAAAFVHKLHKRAKNDRAVIRAYEEKEEQRLSSSVHSEIADLEADIEDLHETIGRMGESLKAMKESAAYWERMYQDVVGMQHTEPEFSVPEELVDYAKDDAQGKELDALVYSHDIHESKNGSVSPRPILSFVEPSPKALPSMSDEDFVVLRTPLAIPSGSPSVVVHTEASRSKGTGGILRVTKKLNTPIFLVAQSPNDLLRRVCSCYGIVPTDTSKTYSRITSLSPPQRRAVVPTLG